MGEDSIVLGRSPAEIMIAAALNYCFVFRAVTITEGSEPNGAMYMLLLRKATLTRSKSLQFSAHMPH